MSGSLKVACVALMAGLMLAATVGMAMRSPPATAPATSPAGATPRAAVAERLARCRTITLPESGCEQAWAAEHRRFFRDDRP